MKMICVLHETLGVISTLYIEKFKSGSEIDATAEITGKSSRQLCQWPQTGLEVDQKAMPVLKNHVSGMMSQLKAETWDKQVTQKR